MKRFDMEIQPQPYYMGEGKSYVVSPYESTNGEWVKWDDVRMLLEVAQWVVEEYECDDGADWQSVWDLARKAISKSKGVL